MTFDELLHLVREVTDLDLDGASPDAAIADALDSLGLVLLLVHLEDHGVPVPDELVASWSTLADVHAQVDRWYGAPVAVTPVARRDPLDTLELTRAWVDTVPVLPEHVPMLHAIASRGRNALAWFQRGRSVSLAEFGDWLWRDAVLQELVVERATGKLLGLVRIADYHERDGHAQLMALAVDPGHSRFLEGAGCLVARAFALWPIVKLYLMVPSYNDALLAPRQHLLVEEGCLKGHETFAGERYDLRIYALYRERFEAVWPPLR
ncbi:MAG: phosphopantetheine-binding protein [Acidimicrobiales bacterium]